jgi:hypothetical protein
VGCGAGSARLRLGSQAGKRQNRRLRGRVGGVRGSICPLRVALNPKPSEWRPSTPFWPQSRLAGPHPQTCRRRDPTRAADHFMEIECRFPAHFRHQRSRPRFTPGATSTTGSENTTPHPIAHLMRAFGPARPTRPGPTTRPLPSHQAESKRLLSQSACFLCWPRGYPLNGESWGLWSVARRSREKERSWRTRTAAR